MAIYSDLNSIFPTTKYLLEDFQSVNQALITLFNTRPGEVLFNPEYGIDLEEDLFEVIDDISATAIYAKIFTAVNRFEPRVKIDNANSSVTPKPNENKFELILEFAIQGLDSSQNFQIIGNFSPP